MINVIEMAGEWDARMALQVALRRKHSLDSWMLLVTRLGDGWAWLTVSLLVVVLDFRSCVSVLLPFATGIALEFAAFKSLKKCFRRERPYQKLERVICMRVPSDRFSFPSGHTAAAFVAVAVFGSFYSWLFVPLLVLACLIGFSRVYIGVHYPSDVTAGALLGLACGLMAVLCLG